jgi:hypothetical protein
MYWGFGEHQYMWLCISLLRDRRERKAALHRDRVHRGRDAARPSRAREIRPAPGAEHRYPSRLCLGRRTQKRGLASRHQTRKHHAAAGCVRKSARFWNRQAQRTKETPSQAEMRINAGFQTASGLILGTAHHQAVLPNP